LHVAANAVSVRLTVLAREETSMKIETNAPAVTRQERVVDAPPEVVFALLADVRSWPRWQPAVSTAELEGAGELAVGTSFRWRSGGTTIVSTVQELAAPSTIGWTGRALGTRAVHVWALEPVDGGTRVRTEESMSGWLPRILAPVVRRMLDRGVAATLDALERATGRG
jgi:uncharacterized protein YndB with AHSA1/START domain